jgi:hypothetical protein
MPPPNLSSSLSLSMTDLGALSLLQTRLVCYEESKRGDDRLMLSQALIGVIPILSRSGLCLDPLSQVLWLVGRCSSGSTVHVFGVSPSVRPSWPWEVVWNSEISFPVPAAARDLDSAARASNERSPSRNRNGLWQISINSGTGWRTRERCWRDKEDRWALRR